MKGLGPCIFDLDPDLATWSSTSLPCTHALTYRNRFVED